MTTIKLKFRKSTVAGNAGNLFYQLINNRNTYCISTGYHIHPDEWDGKNATITMSACDLRRYSYLNEAQKRVKWEMKQLRSIVSEQDDDNNFSFTAVKEEFAMWKKENSLKKFMTSIATKLETVGKLRTAETYYTALRSFMLFRQGKDIIFEELDTDMATDYQAFLLARGVSRNTVSFYMRILRATYNRAVEHLHLNTLHPFKHVYTGNDKTPKRAIPLKELKRIKKLNLSHRPALEFARDMFLFSFYTRGMSFIDIAFLRKTDINNGILIYRRHKTSQQLHIKWENCMQEIANRYHRQSSCYLFPIINTENETEARKQYRNSLYLINKHLKTIAQMAGIKISLSTYVARHSWASIARYKNVPLSIISEGMGHDSETTTRIYLASLDTTLIDRANNLILSSL